MVRLLVARCGLLLPTLQRIRERRNVNRVLVQLAALRRSLALDRAATL